MSGRHNHAFQPTYLPPLRAVKSAAEGGDVKELAELTKAAYATYKKAGYV
ncbi:MAG: hypothetical protein ACPHN2_12150 [Sinimarinibacterium flocculans]